MSAQTRLLLVDDDASVRELTQELLGLSGYSAVPAADAAAALALLAAGERFDGLITDQSMPGMSGADLIGHVRTLLPGLPCLLMTGHGDVAGLTAEVVVLRKPFRASELATAVRKMLKR